MSDAAAPGPEHPPNPEAASGAAAPRRRRGTLASLRPVLAYSLPYWRTILVVFALTGIYGGAVALRFGMAGLIVDGVLLPADAAEKKGRWVRIFEERVIPHLPGDVGLARAYRASDSVDSLEIASGTVDPEAVPEEADSDGLWRYEFSAGVASWRSTAGATVDRASFDRLVVSLPAPLGDLQPPLAVETAIISLSRAEGGVGGDSLVRLLLLIGGAGLFLSLLIAITNFGREYLALGVQVRTVASIRADIFRHLSTQGLDFFNERRSGDIISRITNDVSTIQQSLRYIFGDLIQHPITIIWSLGFAYVTSPLLTLIVLPFLPLLVLPILRSGRKVKRHGRGSLVRLGEVTESMGQLLSGIRVVKAFGLEQAQRREFDERNAGFVRSSLRMTRAKVTSRSLIEGLYNLMATVALVAGGWLLARQALDIKMGDFVAFLMAITALYPPLKAITRVYNTVSESSAGAERVLDILEESPTITDAPGATPFPPFAGSIRFENVWFRYGPSEPWVLHEIELEARRGETIALVGHSGAGKSTLLDLLPRFHDVGEGRILLDGRDLRDGTRASLLAQIAIVGQDPFLFHTTIEENIRGGRPDATDEEVRRAAEAAAIADEIEAMPEGYRTVIGERGVKLSGGQRQRITIARAILKNAAILILDEATSALDTGSERKVQRALDNLLVGRTTFVIAHRLSTIQDADCILVLEAGKIVERGTHDELAARQGVYSRLLRMQEIAGDPSPRAGAAVGDGIGEGAAERSEG